MPFNKTQSFRNFEIRRVKGKAGGHDLRIEAIELTINEYSVTVGLDPMLELGKADAIEK